MLVTCQVVVCGLELLLAVVAVATVCGVHGAIGIITCLLLDHGRRGAALLFQRAADAAAWAGCCLGLQR